MSDLKRHTAIPKTKSDLYQLGRDVNGEYSCCVTWLSDDRIDIQFAGWNRFANLSRFIKDNCENGQDVGGQEDLLNDLFHAERQGTMTIIQRIEHYLNRYVCFTDPAYVLPLALWITGTYIYPEFDAYPYLVITSLTKRSGKTRLSELIGFTSANPRQFSAMTGPTLYRSIQDEHPTIIFDEAETLSSEAASIQRSVLNVGYRKGQTIPRTVGGKIQDFDTYCPKVFVLIGDVYETLKDRSIILPMRRGEPSERFLYNVAKDQGAELRNEIVAQIKTHTDTLVNIYEQHKGLNFLTDRDEEIWTPLFTLAQAFCPSRIKELSAAAVDMATEKTAESKRYIVLGKQEDAAVEDEYAQKLLIDLYGLFVTGGRVISTKVAIDALRAIPIAPWRKFRGSGIDAHDLSNMLSRFGVRPVRIATGSGRGKQTFMRGYKRDHVERAVKELK